MAVLYQGRFASKTKGKVAEQFLLLVLLLFTGFSMVSNGWLVSLDRGLWFDEALTVFFIQQNWAGLMSLVVDYEANMALYYGALKVIAGLNDNEVLLRGVSFIAFVLTISIIASSTRHFFGTRAAIAFIILCGSHFYLIRYSVEVRGYALAGLAMAVIWIAWLNGLFNGHKQSWWWYTLGGIVGLHFHFFVALGVFVLGSITLLCYRHKLAFRPWLLIHSLVVLSFLPIAVFTLTREQGQLDWLTTPGLRALLDVAFMYAGAAPEALNGARRLLLLATFSIVLLGLWVFWQQRYQEANNIRLQVTLAALAVATVPVGLVFTVSQVMPIFSGRFFVPFVPFFWLAIALILSQVFSPRVMLALLAGLTLLLAVSASAYGERDLVSWRAAVELPLSRCNGSEGFLFMTPNAQAAFQFYQSREGTSGHCDWTIYPYKMTSNNYLKPVAGYPQKLMEIGSLERVWVYKIHNKSAESAVLANYLRQLEQDFSCRGFIDSGDFQVLECQQSPSNNMHLVPEQKPLP